MLLNINLLLLLNSNTATDVQT